MGATIGRGLKAVVAFVVPGAVALTFAMDSASAGGDRVTGNEWIAAGLACVITSGAVWATPNAPKAAPRA